MGVRINYLTWYTIYIFFYETDQALIGALTGLVFFLGVAIVNYFLFSDKCTRMMHHNGEQ